MDQSAARDCRHRMDGWHALFAAAVRLSLRIRSRIEAVRDVQGDGTAAAEGDHQPGDDRDLALGALPRLGWPLVFGRLVTWQASAGCDLVGRPRVFFPLRQGFRRRPERERTKVLSYYQRDTDYFYDRDRHSGGGKAVLTKFAANPSGRVCLRKADRFSILLTSHPTQAD